MISRSTCRSTTRCATDRISSRCGIVSKYFDRSVSTTSVKPRHRAPLPPPERSINHLSYVHSKFPRNLPMDTDHQSASSERAADVAGQPFKLASTKRLFTLAAAARPSAGPSVRAAWEPQCGVGLACGFPQKDGPAGLPHRSWRPGGAATATCRDLRSHRHASCMRRKRELRRIGEVCPEDIQCVRSALERSALKARAPKRFAMNRCARMRRARDRLAAIRYPPRGEARRGIPLARPMWAPLRTKHPGATSCMVLRGDLYGAPRRPLFSGARDAIVLKDSAIAKDFE